MFFLDSLSGEIEGFEDRGSAAKPDCCAVSEFSDCLRCRAQTCFFYPAHLCRAYPSVSICSSRSMALRTSSLMVSIFSSALFLAFSLGGFSFGGAFSPVCSSGSVLAAAGFWLAGLVSPGGVRLGGGRVLCERGRLVGEGFWA